MVYHILVLEDDKPLLYLYELYLKRGDFKVTLTEFADDALMTLATQKIDLLMVDVNLNQPMNGIDVIKHIRQNEQYKRPEVLIVSSFPERYIHMTQLNIAGILTKPVKYQELMQKLNIILPPSKTG